MTAASACSTALAEPAALAAMLLAIAPRQLRGANLRAPAGAARDAWIESYCTLACQTPPIRLPPSVTDDALDGGLDLSATLSAGMPIYRAGTIDAATGRTLLLAMAERWSRPTAARVAAALDRSDGSDAFTVVALDEGLDDDERPPEALLDRVAFHLVDLPAPTADRPTQERIAEARSRLPAVEMTDDMIETLVDVAGRMGIASIRPIQFAVHAARAHASLSGRSTVDEGDVTAAATLVLAPRAIALPAPPMKEPDLEQRSDDDPAPDIDEASTEQPNSSPQDRIVEACVAHLPKNLLDGMRSATSGRAKGERGRKGASKLAGRQGRTVGARKGVPKHGERLSLSATLLAAAPWQRVRRRDESARTSTLPRPFHFRKDDLRLHRHKITQRVTTVFSVDASGSSAIHRLAEAKGAVEQLLAQSYVRRDRVALIAFRARRAEALLHPTRSLARARRALAELPGGGATPLASGIREAHVMAGAVLRSGQQCHVVVLTDGCANVDTEGRAGRVAAFDEALLMARRVRADGIASLVIDISPAPGQQSLALADALGARYVPLPHGCAENITEAVRQFRRAGHTG